MNISHQQLREDLDFLFDTVFDVHPQPDFRVSMRRLEAERVHCQAQVQTCESVADFWGLVQRFFHVLGDGHTLMAVPESPEVRRSPLRTTLVDGQRFPAVVPHYWVQPSLRDFRARRDPALQLARGLCESAGS